MVESLETIYSSSVGKNFKEKILRKKNEKVGGYKIGGRMEK